MAIKDAEAKQDIVIANAKAQQDLMAKMKKLEAEIQILRQKKSSKRSITCRDMRQKMGSGGMDLPAISREEQVMRDLPKGNVATDDEQLKRLNPNMDFRTADEMEADKAQTLQSDMMMLQNLVKNANPRERLKKLEK